MSTLKAKVILNIKTSSEWSSSTDVLLEGEIGIESDTRLIKIGDGAHIWNALPYGAIPDIRMLNGVTVTNPNNGEVFTYSNGLWVNSPLPSLPADTDLSHYDNTTSGFITASDIPALPADTDLSHYDNSTSDFATVSQIPTDVSQLNNDAGYITSASIPTVNDGIITIQQNGSNVASFTTNQATNETVNITIPTNISAFNNDVGYLTNASLPAVNDGILTIKQNNTAVGTFSANSAANSAINITVPTKTSDIVNDSGFITSSSIPVVNNGTLTIKQDGNTVATFNANSANNVVANLTSGGGGGGGGASYTSQLTVDSSLIPDTDNVYSLGSAASRWTYLYATYLSSGDGTAITLEQSLVPDTDSTYDLGSSSYNFNAIYTDSIVLNGTTYTSIPTDTSDLTNNAGFITSSDIPALPSNTDLSDYDNSNSGFITSASLPTVNDATLTIQKNSSSVGTFTANASSNVTIDISVPTDTNDLTNGAGFIANPVTTHIIPNADNTYNLGDSSSAYWKHVATHQIDLGSSVVVYSPDSPNYNQLMFKWYDEANSSSRYVLFKDNSFYPTSSGADLGTTTFVWSKVYTTNLVLNGTSYNSIPTDTSDLTNGAGFLDSSIFSSNNTWTGSNSFRNITTTGDITYSIGDGDNRFKEVYSRIYRLSKKAHMYTNSTDGYDVRFEWWNNTDNVSRTLIFGDNNIYPTSNKTISLGNTNNYWGTVYSTSITFSGSSYLSYNSIGGSDELLLNWKTGVVNFKIKAEQGSIHSMANGDIDLGSAGARWNTVWSNKFSISNTEYIETTNALANIGMCWTYNNTAYELCCYHTSVMPNSNNTLQLGTDGHRWKQLFAVSSTINTSDRRAKENIEDLEKALDKLNSIGVKSYTMKGFDKHINYGFIAQDELERNSELVYVPDSYSEDEDGGLLGVVESNVLFLAVKAIQELSSKVDELNAKIKLLEESK